MPVIYLSQSYRHDHNEKSKLVKKKSTMVVEMTGRQALQAGPF